MNAQAWAALMRFAIVRCPKSVKHPPASITAPDHVLRRDHTTEALRRQMFDQSARTVGGLVADLVSEYEIAETLDGAYPTTDTYTSNR